jgi:lipoprotein-anchoring transpeptidase ErfK/SrfK
MRHGSIGWWLSRVAAAVLATPLVAAGQSAQSPRALTPSIERRVVVSLPERKLAVIVNGEVIRVFAVAVGAPSSPSPVGRFTIVNRLENPTYYRPGKVIGPGPTNPLGTRWLGLNVKGYGIHGTDEPDSIGYARSHGCIRLRNRDVEALFPLLRAGDTVELVAERTTETARLFNPPPAAVTATASVPADLAPTPADSLSRKE